MGKKANISLSLRKRPRAYFSVSLGVPQAALCTRMPHIWQFSAPCFFLSTRYPEAMKSPELKDLFPNLSPGELRAAEDNLDQYLEIAWEIFEDAELAEVLNAFPESASRGTIEERSILPTN